MRDPLVENLVVLYRNDPDAGVHGSAEWTLRQWKQDAKLKTAQSTLPNFNDRGNRRWFRNSQGQTFSMIDGPVEFLMGTPLDEPERTEGNDQAQKRVKIRASTRSRTRR